MRGRLQAAAARRLSAYNVVESVVTTTTSSYYCYLLSSLRGALRCLVLVGDDSWQLTVDVCTSQVDDVEQINTRLMVAWHSHRLVVVLSHTQPHSSLILHHPLLFKRTGVFNYCIVCSVYSIFTINIVTVRAHLWCTPSTTEPGRNQLLI